MTFGFASKIIGLNIGRKFCEKNALEPALECGASCLPLLFEYPHSSAGSKAFFSQKLVLIHSGKRARASGPLEKNASLRHYLIKQCIGNWLDSQNLVEGLQKLRGRGQKSPYDGLRICREGFTAPQKKAQEILSYLKRLISVVILVVRGLIE